MLDYRKQVGVNFRIEFYFHRANRSAIRRSSSTSEMPISGFSSISRSRRIASVTPSSSSAHGLCSDLKSELARRARCFSESPKASFSMSANAVLIFSTEYSKISVDSTVYCQVSRKSGSERLCSIEQASKQGCLLSSLGVVIHLFHQFGKSWVATEAVEVYVSFEIGFVFVAEADGFGDPFEGEVFFAEHRVG